MQHRQTNLLDFNFLKSNNFKLRQYNEYYKLKIEKLCRINYFYASFVSYIPIFKLKTPKFHILQISKYLFKIIKIDNRVILHQEY